MIKELAGLFLVLLFLFLFPTADSFAKTMQPYSHFAGDLADPAWTEKQKNDHQYNDNFQPTL